jgi:hypothetical protein
MVLNKAQQINSFSKLIIIPIHEFTKGQAFAWAKKTPVRKTQKDTPSRGGRKRRRAWTSSRLQEKCLLFWQFRRRWRFGALKIVKTPSVQRRGRQRWKQEEKEKKEKEKNHWGTVTRANPQGTQHAHQAFWKKVKNRVESVVKHPADQRKPF